MTSPLESDTRINKPFTVIAVVIFGIVSLAHLIRVFMAWEVTVNGVLIPVWISVIGFVVAGALAIMLRREMR